MRVFFGRALFEAASMKISRSRLSRIFPLTLSMLAVGAMFAAPLSLSGILPQPVQAAPGLVSGQEQWENVNTLTSQIQWFRDLNQAEQAARQKGKMVFYMHMLGKIDGAT